MSKKSSSSDYTVFFITICLGLGLFFGASALYSAGKLSRASSMSIDPKDAKTYIDRCITLNGTPNITYWSTDELIGQIREVYCSYPEALDINQVQ